MPDGPSAKSCCLCKRPFTAKEIKQRRKLKSQRVSEALAMAKSLGEPVGRPRVASYEEIKTLRASGVSFGEIAAKLNCSLRTISRALK